ncbi:hypothetical protein JRQ81_019156 [Phrynocephalus forsythii]|uniref:CD99 antigen n=1 Tax=Phrynocephalus forsythii TaxID=171643 RepID=A0A9Q0XLD8_9SAUR|nr:hypothetical protein JRQ81_019156 [Phrynocephalus forsythii]
MPRLALLVAVALVVLLATQCRGQDLDLSDALDLDSTTKPTTPEKKQPAIPPKKPTDSELDLHDAFGDNDPKNPGPPPPRPQPGSHDDTGGLSDADLFEGNLPTYKPEPEPDSQGSQGMVAGIVSSIAVAIVGALSSFIAYQKKKLCFKAGDQENVNMESQQGAHAEPPVQRTLLQKS